MGKKMWSCRCDVLAGSVDSVATGHPDVNQDQVPVLRIRIPRQAKPGMARLPTAYGTALGMIERGRFRDGETVLVSGASGGVGLPFLREGAGG